MNNQENHQARAKAQYEAAQRDNAKRHEEYLRTLAPFVAPTGPANLADAATQNAHADTSTNRVLAQIARDEAATSRRDPLAAEPAMAANPAADAARRAGESAVARALARRQAGN